MAKKDTNDLKDSLLKLKAEALNVYKAAISKEVDIVNAINSGDFDKLFEILPKESWANLATQAKDAAGSWFFSGLKTSMFEQGLEGLVSQVLVQSPLNQSTAFAQENAKKIMADYFELDAKGMIKPEDLQANKDAFSVFADVATGMKSSGNANAKNHTIVVDHKMFDGTDTHLEAKFDSGKFADWIKYNLVEEHYLDHFDA